MTGHVGFDSRVLRGVFQEVSRVGRVSVSGLPNSNHSRKEARGFVRRRLADWFRLKTPLIVVRVRAKRRERSTNGRSNRCDPRQSCTANSAAWAAADPEGLPAQGELISLSRDRARPPLEYAAQTDHSSAGGLQILERHVYGQSEECYWQRSDNEPGFAPFWLILTIRSVDCTATPQLHWYRWHPES